MTVPVNELTGEIDLPADFAVAVMTGRPQMLKAIRRPNGLNAKETEQVANGFGVLVETNVRLQGRVRELEGRLSAISSLVQEINQVNSKAHNSVRGLVYSINKAITEAHE